MSDFLLVNCNDYDVEDLDEDTLLGSVEVFFACSDLNSFGIAPVDSMLAVFRFFDDVVPRN